jgi:hypothetical protein
MLVFSILFLTFSAVFVRAAYHWLVDYRPVYYRRGARVARNGAPGTAGRQFADYSGFDQDRILRNRCESWEVN